MFVFLFKFISEQRLTNTDIVETLNNNQKLSSKVQLKICESLDSIAQAMKASSRKKNKSKKTNQNNEVVQSESESDSLSD